MLDMTNFQKAKKYWQMGKFYDWSDSHVHPMTHALHYGSSIFEGIRSYPTDKGPAVFRLPEHIDRLFHSASVLNMTLPYKRQALIEVIKRTVKENELESAYIRPLAYYSYGGLSLVPKSCPVEVIVGAYEKKGAYLGEKSTHGVSVYILPSPRIHPRQLDISGKLGGFYVQSVINSIRARSLGYDEGMFLNWEGNVAEGAGENVFVVTGNVVKTNDASESILEGITRTSILELARDLGYGTVVGAITKKEFLDAEEAFFTGTAAEVAPIVRVMDGSTGRKEEEERTIGTGQAGPVTKRLIGVYSDAVRGKNQKYRKWLTWIAE